MFPLSSPSLHSMSFFSPLLSSPLRHFLVTSSPAHRSLNFIEKRKKRVNTSHVSPKPQPHSFSSPQSPAAASNRIPSSPPLCPLLSLSPSLTSSPHPLIKPSPASLKFQCMCHATPRLSLPPNTHTLFFPPRSVSLPFTRYRCSSFLSSPTVTQHRLVRGGDERGENEMELCEGNSDKAMREREEARGR